MFSQSPHVCGTSTLSLLLKMEKAASSGVRSAHWRSVADTNDVRRGPRPCNARRLEGRRSDQTTRSVPSAVRTGAYPAGWCEVNGQKLGGLGLHGAAWLNSCSGLKHGGLPSGAGGLLPAPELPAN